MNKLENYASDEEYQTSDSRFSQEQGKYKQTEQDVNYDNITMEMSEESSHHEPSSPTSDSSDSSRSSSNSYHDESDRRFKKKDSYQRSDEKSQHSDSPEYHKLNNRDSEKRRKYYRGENYYRERDSDRRNYRHSRSPSYHRYERSRKSRSRSPRDRGRHSRREHYSPSRRRREHHDRSRGSGGGGGGIGGGNGGASCDRKPSKLSILEKLGIELKLPDTDKDNSPLTLPSYYNPVAMNPAKYAEQIAKRKLLWGNAQKQKQGSTEATTIKPESKTTSVWQGARFSQDQDGKLTAKFQRLMGIKRDSNGADSSTSSQVRQDKDILKKQEELFSSMEMQYEVARQATHTQRGVGLGFGAHHFSSK